MKCFSNLIFFSLICILLPLEVMSQSDVVAGSIHVLTRVQKNRILLRWAPDNPLAWDYLNNVGYILERHTLTRDGVALDVPEKVVLSVAPILPLPLDQWMDLIEEDDQCAIIAQALYGEKFEVEGGNAMASVINQASDLQQRYSFSLFAADHSFEAAMNAGWGYIDEDVRDNEKYLYRVLPFKIDDRYSIDGGSAFVGLDDFEELPSLDDVSGIFSEGSAILRWNDRLLKRFYNSYWVERSQDGVCYERLNAVPLANLNESSSKDGFMNYVDSLPENGRVYYYRVRGISCFGETGPPSRVILGIGQRLIHHAPVIVGKELREIDGVLLQWNFPDGERDLLFEFRVNRAGCVDGPWGVIKSNISPGEDHVLVTGLGGTNYITISAVGKSGQERISMPVLVQPVDSIPPKPPMGLTAKVDTSGHVELRWTPNTEDDLAGYRVFRGNQANEEFSQITVHPVTVNEYSDFVNLKSLNEQVFYRVVAVDHRHNQSDFSDVLRVDKPDVVPPSSPVFSSCEVQNGAVLLSWILSLDLDVMGYRLYRKTDSDNYWKQIKEIREIEVDSVGRYTDSEVDEGRRYAYTIVAVDDVGLESIPAPAVSMDIPTISVKPGVKNLDVYRDPGKHYLEIFWGYRQEKVAGFNVYRAVKGGPLTLYRVVEGDVHRIVDERVKPNTDYIYGVRAFFEDGTFSKFRQLKVLF